MEKESTAQGKKELGLTTKILIALLAGAFVGVVLNYAVPHSAFVDTVVINGLLYLVGQGFIRLMQMLVVPLVFCSLVCGSMSIGDIKKLGAVGIRTIAFYLVTTALAITLSLGIANVINPGIGLNMSAVLEEAADSVDTSEKSSFADTLLDMIPTNVFRALTEGNMLPIILFALLLGIILAKLGSRAEIVGNFFAQGNDIMMEMTELIMKAAPVGVFCLIGKTFAATGFDALIPLLKYIGAVLIALAIHCIIVYLGLLKVFTGLSPVLFIKKFFPAMAFAFSTATSNATIPMSIDILETKMGVSKRISSFTIPLGATINMDGTAIMQGAAVVFVAQAYGIQLSALDHFTVISTPTMASIGTAGVPGVGLITLTMGFHSVGLPVDAIALIMGIDRILDMARTAVNITGDAVCTTIVASKNGAVDRGIYEKQQ